MSEEALESSSSPPTPPLPPQAPATVTTTIVPEAAGEASTDASMQVPTFAASAEKRRSTVPEILPHQKSFEKRYSHIIHKQILETSINMDALKRQMNVYLPVSRAASLQNEEASALSAGGRGNDVGHANEPLVQGIEEEEVASAAEAAISDARLSLEKMDTLDIAKK